MMAEGTRGQGLSMLLRAHGPGPELTVFAQQRDHGVVVAPDDIFDERSGKLGDDLLLLNVKQDDAGGAAEQERSRATVENVVRLNRAFDRLGDLIVQVANLDRLRCLVQDGETVASDEQRR